MLVFCLCSTVCTAQTETSSILLMNGMIIHDDILELSDSAIILKNGLQLSISEIKDIKVNSDGQVLGTIIYATIILGITAGIENNGELPILTAIGFGMLTGAVMGLLFAVIPNHIRIDGNYSKYEGKKRKLQRNLNGAGLDRFEDAIGNDYTYNFKKKINLEW